MVKLHLTACRSWVGRWDDGGLVALLLLYSGMLFVVACCCCYCFVFACVYQCLLARVGVLGHRRGTALGHPSGMPPTGAIIVVLLLKTWLAPDSTNTWQPSVLGWSVRIMAERAVLDCCGVLLPPFALFVYAST